MSLHKALTGGSVRRLLISKSWNWKTFLVFFGIWIMISYPPRLRKEVSPTIYSFNNYFLSAEKMGQLGFIVNTSSCSILNISAWDEAILPILSKEAQAKPENCDNGQWRRWTYTHNWNLIINETDMRESGYSWTSVTCCYFAIHRVTQELSNYDEDADNNVKFSSCQPITDLVTPMPHPYIRVQCSGKFWPVTSEVLYRRFHAVAVPPESTSRKSRFWSDRRKPPNVVIVGIDSMSRLSFIRLMPKTRRILQQLGAIEFLGYTKVGENTFPNIMAGFGGYPQEEMSKFCFFKEATAQDGCPYLWNRFSEANYLTAFIEDAPRIAIFNYLKTGFVNPPTDIFLRPFVLGTQKRLGIPNYYRYLLPCIDNEVAHRVLLRYMSDIVGMANQVELPLFLFSWITSLTHDSSIAGKFGDEDFEGFLESLDLNNTVLVFMSDHGYRFGSIRETFPGWYEDKLPNFWMYLPNSVTDEHPSWVEALQDNSALTSPFDLFWTLSQLLDEYTTSKPLRLGIVPMTTQPIPRKFGQSLFKPVPVTRKCDEAGIRENYCACRAPIRLSGSDTRIIGSAQGAINAVNALLPPACSPLEVEEVKGGAVIYLTAGQSLTEPINGTYVVDFYTKPGGFLFEATVDFYATNSSDPGQYIMNSEVLRMNRISGDVSCVTEAALERICFCQTPV